MGSAARRRLTLGSVLRKQKLAQPSGPTNELAKERNRAATERTLIAWMQNCLILLGLGIALDEINQAITVRSPTLGWLTAPEWAVPLALGFVFFSMVLLGIALRQYRLEMQAIEHQERILYSLKALNRWVVGAIVLFGLVSGAAIVLSTQN